METQQTESFKTSGHLPSGFPRPFEDLEEKISVKFINQKLFEEALTHKSYAMERSDSIPFNERLEFLGDSILNAVITEFLFKRFPNDDEGRLSKLKSLLVARPALCKWGKELKIGSFLRMSESEEITGGRERDSNLANVMESLIGALFLDQGFEVARSFILKKFSQKRRIVETDFKSKLQEIIQEKYHIPPTYVVIHATGPEHSKIFHTEVHVKKKLLGKGLGKSKKESEQSAARSAIQKIKKGSLKLTSNIEEL